MRKNCVDAGVRRSVMRRPAPILPASPMTWCNAEPGFAPVQVVDPDRCVDQDHRRRGADVADLSVRVVIAVLIDGCASLTLALCKHWSIMAACEPSISAMFRTR